MCLHPPPGPPVLLHNHPSLPGLDAQGAGQHGHPHDWGIEATTRRSSLSRVIKQTRQQRCHRGEKKPEPGAVLTFISNLHWRPDRRPFSARGPEVLMAPWPPQNHRKIQMLRRGKGNSKHGISLLRQPSAKHSVFCSYLIWYLSSQWGGQFLRGRTFKVRLGDPHRTWPPAAAPHL